MRHYPAKPAWTFQRPVIKSAKSMKTSVTEESMQGLTARLQEANNALATKYPGESGRRQPVHTVYGGAHLFKSDSAARLGAVAVRTFQEYAPDFTSFAQ